MSRSRSRAAATRASPTRSGWTAPGGWSAPVGWSVRSTATRSRVRAQVLRSDGRTDAGRRSTSAGIPSPADINAVVAVDGALVVAGRQPRRRGHRRGARLRGRGLAQRGRRRPGPRARCRAWCRGPDYRDESYAAQSPWSGDRLLAGGTRRGHGRRVVLRATPARPGTGVDSPAVDELYAVSGLVADGSTVVVSGSARGLRTAAAGSCGSTDGGATWAVAPSQPPAEDGEGYGAALGRAAGGSSRSAEPSFERLERAGGLLRRPRPVPGRREQ